MEIDLSGNALMVALAKQGWEFFREHSLAETLVAVRSQDAHPLVQFTKYVLCGGLSVVTLAITVIILSQTLFPAALDPDAPKALAKSHQLWANWIGFIPANLVAYFTNRILVFTPGRHGALVEFLIFTAVAAAATAVGMLAGPYLIERIGLDPRISQCSLIVTSALVNFAARKFLVFSK